LNKTQKLLKQANETFAMMQDISRAQLKIVREELIAANLELSQLRQLEVTAVMGLNFDLQQQLLASQTSDSTLTGLSDPSK